MNRARTLLAVLMLLACGACAASRETGAPDAPDATDASNTARQAGLEWELVHWDAPSVVWANRTEWFEVGLRNAGTATWSDANRDRLAYHWLDDRGNVVEFDGQRTFLKQTVGRGATLVRSIRVYGPPSAGRFTLELEPVREGVAWYGSPRGGASRRASVVALWRCSVFEAAAALLGLAVVLTRSRFARLAATAWFAEAAWPAWTFLSTLASLVAFSELSGLELFGKALWLSVSGAFLPAASVALLPAGARRWAAAAWSVLVAALVFADLLYLEFYGAIVPVSALSLTQNLGEVRASIASLMRSRHLWLTPLPVATVAMAVAARHRAHRTNVTAPRPLLAAWLLFAVFALSAIPALSGISRLRREVLGHHVISELRVVRSLGVLNAHALDIAGKLSAADRRRAAPGEREGVVDFFAKRAAAAANAPKAPSFGAARGMNLLLVQVESAQGWIIDAKIGGKPVTPFLDELRGRALYYSRISDQTCQGMTADSEYAILNSQHPLPDESIAFLRADNHFFTLAHVLRDGGYSTLSAHPFERGFWNRATLHPRYGFQRSYFRDELGPGMTIGWGLADGVLFERLVPILLQARQPFFAFVVTLSLHHPFSDFPQELTELDTHELQNRALANYLEGMHYFDRSLRELFARLERAGLAENTVVAVYGDHDPRFGLDEEMLRLAGFERKGAGIFDVLDRIPFFVVLPPRAAAALPEGLHEIDVPGGHVDVAPTLLSFLGVERPRAFLGQALLPGAGPDFAARPDGGALTRDHLFLTRGFDVPAEGGCFSLPAREHVPLGECRGIGRAAARELEMSRRVVDLDLHRTLAQLPSPKASVASSP